MSATDDAHRGLATSRYQRSEKFATIQAGSLGREDIAEAVKSLRATFNREKTTSKEWRIGQLKAFGRLVRRSPSRLPIL